MLENRIISLQDPQYEGNAIVYSDPEVEKKACIFYLHGGGLLYGSKEDLPELHINTFTSAGYVIVAMDYPLAPAAKIDVILPSITDAMNRFFQDPELLPEAELPYFLWGRSAGAYLSLLAAAGGALYKNPMGVISYYGYGFLCDHWYCTGSDYYNKLPKVPEICLEHVPQEIHGEGDLETHYSAYVYARQTGRWKDLFYIGRDKYFMLDYSLRCVDYFPCPIFAAHGTGDPDVPYQEFLELCNKYHVKRFLAVSKEHDFDRDEKGKYTARLLKETVIFMDKIIEGHR